MNLTPGVLCARIVIAVYGIHAFQRNNSPQIGGPVHWMRQWMQERDDLVYLRCEDSLENSGNVLMRQLSWKYTRWTHLRDLFIQIYLQNMYLNTRTVLVTSETRGGSKLCISQVSAARWWYLIDTVILTYDKNKLGHIRGLVARRGKGSTDTVSSFLARTEVAEPERVKTERAKSISRKCVSFGSGHSGKWKSSLEGCEISLGCFPVSHYAGPKTTCEYMEFEILHSALRAVNATPQFRFYADYDSMTADLLHGRVDIAVEMSVLNPFRYRWYAFPVVLEYSHEKFYTWKGEHEQLFFDSTVIRSKEAVGFLLASFGVAWLALCLGEFLELGCHWDGSLVMKFGTFLFASLLATPFPIPRKRAGRAFAKSQTIIIFVWVLAIFPLSFYLRSELTSRLTITVPPNPVDTIDELERALDTGQLAPCMVRYGALQFLFDVQNDATANLNNIDRKLKQAFEKGGSSRMFSHPFDCLRSCAMKAGHACIKYSHDDCPQHEYARGYVVSREPLRLVMAFIPVRKDFERARAYENLLRRIFETGLDVYSPKHRIHCDPLLTKGDVNYTGLNDDDEMHSSQTFKLSMFFASLSFALSIATIVFCLEVAVGSRRQEFVRHPNDGITAVHSSIRR